MENLIKAQTGRRDFLKFGGGALLAGSLLLESCKKDDDNATPADSSLTLTNDDYGILNFAYALEQLEADFYARVVANSNFGSAFSMEEQGLLRDIAEHERAHREFFKAALGTKAIKGLTPKYGTLNFGDRTQVLATAKAFEDLGVSAYNGAGVYIADASYLTLAGKIVSVEARHAAFIRELIFSSTGSGSRFVDSDVVNVDYSKIPATLKSPVASASNTPLTDAQLGFSTTNNSIEKSRKPSEVLAIAGAYITETLVNKLP